MIEIDPSPVLGADFRLGDELAPLVVRAMLAGEADGLLPRSGSGGATPVVVAGIGAVAGRAMAASSFATAFHGRDVAYTVLGTAYGRAEDLFDDRRWDMALVFSPFKAGLGALVDELSPGARLTGCVDTVIRTGGRAAGMNVNSWTIQVVLEQLCGRRPPRRVRVLGAGASARSCLLALRRAWGGDVDVEVWARRARAAIELAPQFGARAIPASGRRGDADGPGGPALVVNCTGWGETPESEAEPLTGGIAELLGPGAVLLDLNNRQSTLQQSALLSGSQVISGVVMRDLNHECRAALSGRLR